MRVTQQGSGLTSSEALHGTASTRLARYHNKVDSSKRPCCLAQLGPFLPRQWPEPQRAQTLSHNLFVHENFFLVDSVYLVILSSSEVRKPTPECDCHLSLLFGLWFHGYVNVCVNASTYGGQRWRIPLDLELQAAVSCTM